jgi:hypothetical protein
MSWQETLNEFFALPNPDASLEFYPPISEQDITLAERELQVRFPQDLKDLLTDTNGVGLHLHLEKPPYDILIGYVIWPVERIVADNTNLRTNNQTSRIYMPFDDFLFFSDAGNGDLFGFSLLKHQESHDQIYRWDHEDDGRICIAHSLKEFIRFISK